MGFQHGLSGLNAAARNLDVIGHNVANANTIGAKASRAEFSEMYATSLYGGATFNGLGVAVDNVSQQFGQGELSTTNNPLDLAINGQGFFRMSDDGAVSFTRNGQFRVNTDGFIVNAQGDHLTGFPADTNGVIQPGVPADLRIRTGDISPKASTTMSATLNLDAREAAPTLGFDVADPTTYNSATSPRSSTRADAIRRSPSIFARRRPIRGISTPRPTARRSARPLSIRFRSTPTERSIPSLPRCRSRSMCRPRPVGP